MTIAVEMAKATQTPHFAPSPARRIEILAFPRVQLLDVAGPLQVFAIANDLAERRGASARYALLVVAAQGPSLATSAGLSLVVGLLPDLEGELDTLVVAGGYGVASVCSGA